MKREIIEIIESRDSVTEESAKEATKAILALKPTKETLCEVIFEMDNDKTTLNKLVDKLKHQIKQSKK